MLKYLGVKTLAYWLAGLAAVGTIAVTSLPPSQPSVTPSSEYTIENTSIKASEMPTPPLPTTEDLQGFVLQYQGIADSISNEIESFLIDSIDPTLQNQYAENDNDVPLMRYLGKKGLNDIETAHIEEGIAFLKASPLAANFLGSIDDLEQSAKFLKRFYSEIVYLNSFEEFKTDTADLRSSQDSLWAISYDLERDYDDTRYAYPSLDYGSTDVFIKMIVSGYAKPALVEEVPVESPLPIQSPPGTPSSYYTNVDGNEVSAPYYAPSAPIGASAQCGDGTYSFSQHRSGTCSHHGGVSEWY